MMEILLKPSSLQTNKFVPFSFGLVSSMSLNRSFKAGFLLLDNFYFPQCLAGTHHYQEKVLSYITKGI